MIVVFLRHGLCLQVISQLHDLLENSNRALQIALATVVLK